jgi:hypothetical protein
MKEHDNSLGCMSWFALEKQEWETMVGHVRD